MEPPQQQVMVASAEAAITALGKLGDLGSRISFELHSTKISQESHELLQQQTIKGDIVMVGQDGQKCATLAYESAQRGRHLSASLALPSGEAIITFQMGSPPQQNDGAGGIFNAIAADYQFGPLPPIMISLLGYQYGQFNVDGMAAGCGACSLLHADGTRGISLPEPKVPTCCFCCALPRAHGMVSAKESSLGKTEVPMQVITQAGAADGSVIHMLMDPKGPKMPPQLQMATGVQEVLCELGGSLGDRDKLDVVIIGASMAALYVTAKWIRPNH